MNSSAGELMKLAEALRGLIQRERSLTIDPHQLKVRLTELCANAPRAHVRAILLAQEEGIVAELAKSDSQDDPCMSRNLLAMRLRDDYGLQPEIAQWAVWAWSAALASELDGDRAVSQRQGGMEESLQPAEQRDTNTWQASARELITQPYEKPVTQVVITETGVLKAGDEREFAGVTFAWIPAGEFKMGSPEAETGRDHADETQHRVTLSKGFWMGKHQVTQGEWEAMMGNNPSHFQGGPRLPVEQVSWEDCQMFIQILNGMGQGVFRLPTEAEWEYACRAGSMSEYCFGDDSSSLGAYAWYKDNSGGRTHPVGEKLANAWGLFDMHGNVYEWCNDWYGEYSSGAMKDPSGFSRGDHRVLRGGSWLSSPVYCRAALRNLSMPNDRYNGFGLRLARTQDH